MILITRLNGKSLYINAEFIRSVETTPDTVITLQDNTKLVIKETVEEVVERFIAYQRAVKAPNPANSL